MNWQAWKRYFVLILLSHLITDDITSHYSPQHLPFQTYVRLNMWITPNHCTQTMGPWFVEGGTGEPPPHLFCLPWGSNKREKCLCPRCIDTPCVSYGLRKGKQWKREDGLSPRRIHVGVGRRTLQGETWLPSITSYEHRTAKGGVSEQNTSHHSWWDVARVSVRFPFWKLYGCTKKQTHFVKPSIEPLGWKITSCLSFHKKYTCIFSRHLWTESKKQSMLQDRMKCGITKWEVNHSNCVQIWVIQLNNNLLYLDMIMTNIRKFAKEEVPPRAKLHRNCVSWTTIEHNGLL